MNKKTWAIFLAVIKTIMFGVLVYFTAYTLYLLYLLFGALTWM